MKLLTMSQASELPDAPTRAYLSQRYKKPNPPAYFIHSSDGPPLVDVENSEWQEMIDRRADEHLRQLGRGGSVVNPKKDKASIHVIAPTPANRFREKNEELFEESMAAKLMDPILKNQITQHKIEMNKMELEKEAKALIETRMAEFLFFSYIERLHSDLLSMPKKIAPIIENLVKEKKPDEVIIRVLREIETILTEVKNAQKADVEKWRHEK